MAGARKTGQWPGSTETTGASNRGGYLLQTTFNQLVGGSGRGSIIVSANIAGGNVPLSIEN